MSASTIIRYIKVQERARKSKQKVEVITGYDNFYAIGPTSIRNFNSHVNKNDNENCKVFCYKNLDEVEAHLNAMEFCIQIMK